MWKIVKLGDVCRINNGGTPKSKVREYWDGGVHWLTPKDMGKLASRYVSETERQISQEGLDNSSAKLIPHQSVILSCRAPIGHVAINEVPMSFNQGCKGLVPSDEILVEYLYYFLVSSRQLLNDLGTGTTFKEISTKTLHQVDVPLPPLPEQQRIVAKLDAAFAEIDRAIELVEASSVQKAQLLQKLIDDNISYEGKDSVSFELGNFCTIKHGFAFQGDDFTKIDDETLPIVLTPGNFEEDGTLCFSEKNTKRCTTLINESLLFPIESLVIVMTDLSSQMKLLGKPAFIRQPNVLHNQRIGWVLNDESVVLNRYLYHFFKSTSYLREIRKTATGTMVRHTAPKRILSTKISVPSSLRHQLKICERIDEIHDYAASFSENRKNQLRHLAALKSAILAQELQPPQSEAA